jgi:hypothetical protein
MSEDDLKSVIAAYQQKAFELFNQNIVLETQVKNLTSRFEELLLENEKLKSIKQRKNSSENFS